MTTFVRAAGCTVVLGMLVGLSGICAGADAPSGNAAEAPAAKLEPADIGRASTVTLDVKDAELATVLAEIAKQSGNKVIAVEAGITPKPVTIKLDKTSYWEALDGLCKQQGLAYQFDANDAMTLVPASAGDVKTSYAGPVVFKLTSISPAGEADGAAVAGKLKCTVNFFWEDRLTPSAFKPAHVEKVTDAAGNPCELPRGMDWTVGKTSTSGGGSMGRFAVLGSPCGGKFSFWLARGADNADAFAEISGRFGLVMSAGKVELRLENALVGVEQSVEQAGYKLTVSKVERHGGAAMLTVAVTRDGKPVEIPWPNRSGWSLVDAEGKVIEGRLMAGCVAIFAVPAEVVGGYALVRTFSPDAAEGTYRFKFEQVRIPK